MTRSSAVVGWAGLGVAALFASAAGAAPPPVAAVRPVADTYFGVTLTDPYRWMEKPSAELDTWMKGQSDYARAALEGLPGRAAMLARVTQLDDLRDEVSSVARAGGKTFVMRRRAGEELPKLYEVPPSGSERLLVDPVTYASGGSHASIDEFTPSPDGSRIAFKVSLGGSEKGVLRVLDVATGAVLPERIDRILFSAVSWLDEKRFYYDRLRELPAQAVAADTLKGISTFVHVIGEDPAKDVAVLGPGISTRAPVGEEQFPLVLAIPGSGGVSVGAVIEGVRPENRYYVAGGPGPVGSATAWRQVADPDVDQVTWVDGLGDDLYLLTHRDAPHFKVLRTSLSHPDLAHATVVVPESNLILQSLVVAQDAVYVGAVEAGHGRLLRVAHGTSKVEHLPLPAEGGLSALGADPRAPGAWCLLSSWSLSPRIEAFDPRTHQFVDTGFVKPAAADFSGVVREETEAVSADGTRVPLSIIHLRAFAKDGSHPTRLHAYGAYGHSEDTEFDPTLLAWLEGGGAYAFCHARGGGEGGEEWHRAGMLLQKQHTIDDVLGCADYLVREHFTSAAHLAVEGGSAGGIAVGGAITQRPELFSAALIMVGLSNVLRFEQTENVYNRPEFGTVQTQEGFRALLIADAYSHVKDHTRYPAVLLTTGANDPRVAPWQAGKMAARLQAATSSGQPILLRVSYDGGHFVGDTRQQRDAETADEFAFLRAHTLSSTR